MADLYPNLRIPQTDFSWLAELGPISEAQTNKEALKSTLADLQSDDTATLRRKAAQAISLGTKEGIDAGMKLFTAAQARENADITRARDAAYTSSVAPALAGILGARAPGAAASAPTEGNPAPFQSAPVAPAAPTPSPFDRSPGAIPGLGPRSEAAPSSPSDQMIAQAQGAVAPPPGPGPQLAGPPPTPDTGPPVPPQAPAWLQGAQMQAEPAPAPPPQAVVPPAAPGAATAARLQQLEATMGGLHPRATAQRAAVAQEIKSTLARDTTLSPEYKTFYNDQADRAAQGLPGQTIADWRNEVKSASKLREDTSDLYVKRYSEGEQKAVAVKDAIRNMREIMNQPNFAMGKPGLLDEFRNRIAAVSEQLRAMGVPDAILPYKETLARMTNPVALREAYASVARQSVIATLGGLGRQISDNDLKYMDASFAGLSHTKRGAELIMKLMDDVADRQTTQAKAAREYFNKNSRATPAGLDQAVTDALDSKYGSKGLFNYSNGNPTQLKLQMDKELGESQAAPAPPSARRVINRDAARKAGYSDAEINAYEQGQ